MKKIKTTAEDFLKVFAEVMNDDEHIGKLIKKTPMMLLLIIHYGRELGRRLFGDEENAEKKEIITDEQVREASAYVLMHEKLTSGFVKDMPSMVIVFEIITATFIKALFSDATEICEYEVNEK